jgi:MFS family permease
VYALLDELVPLYPVYALLFADAGLSTGQISTLFVLWSVTTFVLEVPSGALADRVSRRRLLAFAALLRGAGFAVWVLAPSYPAFAAGFLAWGAASACTSGTWEALVYDELAARAAAGRYAQVVGRSGVLGTLGIVVGTAAAVPLVAIGGYAAAGAASVAACVACAGTAWTLPEQPRTVSAGDTGGLRGYLHTLRPGLTEARSDRRVRRLLVVAAVLPGMTAIDEYLPLLARAAGAPDALVPALLLAPFAGLAVGAEMAGRRSGVRPGWVAAFTAAGAVLLAAGALSGRPVGFLGIGCFYAAMWFGTTIAGSRLQDGMSGTARAAVTSVAGVGAELMSLAIYAGVGAAAGRVGLPLLVAAPAVPLLLLAARVPRWLPAASASAPDYRQVA